MKFVNMVLGLTTKQICSLLLYLSVAVSADRPCVPVQKKSGLVCVCNSTYCDTIERPTELEERQFHVYSTSKNMPGFNHEIGFFRMQAFAPHGYRLKINDDKKRQKIIGFGGSFSDSFGYVVKSLSEGTQDHLLKSYFSPSGVEYSFCRVVLGSCDFSVRHYNYVPNYDPLLKSFNLTEDDYKYKISIIQKANEMSKRKINYMGTLWSAPSWMKRNGRVGTDYLLPKFRQTLADYYVKTLDAFKANGIDFWGLTPGNEPITLIGFKNVTIENMVVLPEEQRDWIAENLGPSLEKGGFPNTSIVVLDDMRHYAKWWMDSIMRGGKADKYVAGVGIHWYMDSFFSPKVFDQLKEKYPEKNIYYTETSINPIIALLLQIQNGTFPNTTAIEGAPPDLGSWARATLYISSVFENLKHWTSGYMDWNLALDINGGPNLINLTCDSPILVNATADEFYKQPLFYAMGHFSKFIQPGAVYLESDLNYIDDMYEKTNRLPQSTIDRILHLKHTYLEEGYEKPNEELDFSEDEILHSEEVPYSANEAMTAQSQKPPPFVLPTLLQYKNVTYIAVLNPDGSHSVIIYNPHTMAIEVSINDMKRGYGFLILEPESLTTVIY